MSKDLQENTVQELREINHLVYLRPSNGALIDKRTMKSYNFTNASYSPGQNMQCIINSGGDFVWGPSSYLRLEVDRATVSAGDTALNFIKSVRLTHRSGEVLEYIQDYNVLAKVMRKFMVSAEDSAKIDQLTDVSQADTNQVICVPMWLLCGVFASQEAFIPGGFLAGAKLELELESSAIALAAAGATYSNVRPTIVLDSAQVYDSVQKQLLEEQADVAGSGLQFTYSTYFSTSNTFAGTSLNFDVQQSASITQCVFAVLRSSADAVADGVDSFNFLADSERYQFRLGSQYFPQQPINSTDKEQAEPYLQSLITFDAAPHQYMGSAANAGGVNATLDSFTNSGDAVYSTTLEKSACGLSLTGEPTNNSRILNVEMTKANLSHKVNVYLKYLRVANVMGSNLIVDR